MVQNIFKSYIRHFNRPCSELSELHENDPVPSTPNLLALFAWITLGINSVLEAALFTPAMASFGFVLVIYGVAALIGSAAIARMFAPPGDYPPLLHQYRSLLTNHPPKMLAGYMVIAVVAFPVIYIIFG